MITLPGKKASPKHKSMSSDYLYIQLKNTLKNRTAFPFKFENSASGFTEIVAHTSDTTTTHH